MTSFMLKCIAVVTMLIDHIGYGLFPKYIWLRAIGRLAMPIFAFQIATGFKKTTSRPKYFLRIFLCAIISEIPFLLLHYSYKIHAGTSLINFLSSLTWKDIELNICFTFLTALLVLTCLEKAKKNHNILWYYPAICLIILSYFIPMDYDILGVLLIVIFYYFQDNKKIYTILSVILTIVYIAFTDTHQIQAFMFVSYAFLYLYNNTRGKRARYLFYTFYPLHMLLIIFVKMLFFT